MGALAVLYNSLTPHYGATAMPYNYLTPHYGDLAMLYNSLTPHDGAIAMLYNSLTESPFLVGGDFVHRLKFLRHDVLFAVSVV